MAVREELSVYVNNILVMVALESVDDVVVHDYRDVFPSCTPLMD